MNTPTLAEVLTELEKQMPKVLAVYKQLGRTPPKPKPEPPDEGAVLRAKLDELEKRAAALGRRKQKRGVVAPR